MKATTCISRGTRRPGPLGLLAALFLTVPLASAAVLEVPAQYATIQEAIDASQEGDIVNVAAGTYIEQLDIPLAITLQGAHGESPVVRSPASLAVKFTIDAVDYRPIVYVHDVEGITVQNLVIDGDGRGSENVTFVGIACHEAGGLISSCSLHGLHETPYSDAANGIGLLAHSVSGARSLTVDGSVVKAYQLGGIVLRGAELTARVEGCLIIGPEEEDALTPPSGVYVGDGALATLEGNEVNLNLSGCATCGPDPRTDSQAAGIRLEDAAWGTRIEDNLLTENDVAIWARGGSQIIENFLMDNRYAGLVLSGGSHDVGGANFQGLHQVGIWVLGEEASDTIELYDLCLNGPGGSPDDASIVGLRAYSAGAPLDVWAHNCTVSQWSVGLRAEGGSTRLDLNESSVHTNWIAGFDNTGSGVAQNAEYNWWGAADGPAPAGSGEVILGPEVDYDPILIEEHDVAVTCGLQRQGNEVGPQSPTDCVSIDNPCVEDIPFTITRTDAAQMRGYTVTFTLSDEIDLCDGLNSITEGSYLDDAGNTHFEKHDNGDGSFTVDCAILGLPCGATAGSGTLFTIDVKKATGQPDGDGAIAMSHVALRDCDNQPIAADMGPAATVTVDTAAPVAVTDLAATQVKTGNTGETTLITVNFTAPGDAAVTEVYRAPFGHYPEYDDDSGAAPSAPSYPPGGDWVLTSVTADGQTDDPPDRDFWYYVVFTQDACGNWSDVSNRTDGTLNYHLGDVTDGVTPGTGDNQVVTADISTLSSSYWKSHGEGGYLNYCDVGPTTDYTVDALPTTDNVIGFEDLMMFAVNYEQVGTAGDEQPAGIVGARPDELPRLVLRVESQQTEPGEILTARLLLEGNEAAVKGIHAVIVCEGREVELERVIWGELLTGQGANVFRSHNDRGESVVLDAAVMGRGITLHGSGEVATLEFRAQGEAAVAVLDVADLRGPGNRFLNELSDLAVGQPAPSAGERSHPLQTALLGARPNPFLRTTDISFSLAREMPVSLRIFDASGRLVRTLVDGTLPAGEHRVTWNGRFNNGGQANVGVYLCTFRAGKAAQTSKMFHYR